MPRKKHRASQTAAHLNAGEAWEASGFVFTNELGHHMSPHSVCHNYKRIAASIGLPEARFHDLRHSFAAMALRSGADIKSVQDALGHHSAPFTLDTYCHVTDEKKRETADRMESMIQQVSGK